MFLSLFLPHAGVLMCFICLLISSFAWIGAVTSLISLDRRSHVLHLPTSLKSLHGTINEWVNAGIVQNSVLHCDIERGLWRLCARLFTSMVGLRVCRFD
jgi:hypothetical protein